MVITRFIGLFTACWEYPEDAGHGEVDCGVGDEVPPEERHLMPDEWKADGEYGDNLVAKEFAEYVEEEEKRYS